MIAKNTSQVITCVHISDHQ